MSTRHRTRRYVLHLSWSLAVFSSWSKLSYLLQLFVIWLKGQFNQKKYSSFQVILVTLKTWLNLLSELATWYCGRFKNKQIAWIITITTATTTTVNYCFNYVTIVNTSPAVDEIFRQSVFLPLKDRGRCWASCELLRHSCKLKISNLYHIAT